MKIERAWAMPNKNTFSIKPIKELLTEEVDRTNKIWLDPFANTNKWGTITNDLNPEYDTDWHEDALDFLKQFRNASVDGVLFDPPFCYDSKTDLFTKNGWKNITEITTEDVLATLNTKTNTLEYQKPVETIRTMYHGDMVSIESQSINLLVTPNHRCYVKTSFYGDFKWLEAKDLFSTSNKVWFKKNCDWSEGRETEYFVLPPVKLIRHNIYGETTKPPKKIPMDLWLKFLGLFISEGYVKKNYFKIDKNGRHRYRYVVSIAQRKPHVREKIKEVLDELGYKYATSPQDFRIDDKQLWTYLSQFKDSHTMFIPEDIKNVSKRQLQILIDYLMLGDGTNIRYSKLNKQVNKMYHYTTNSYYTSSTHLMNDFCEITIKCGYGISVRYRNKQNIWRIHMLGASNFMVNKDKCKLVPFNDYVYCVSVPNTTVLVKRNNRVFWCGNSPRQIHESYKNVGMPIFKETTQSSFWGNLKKEIARIVKPEGKVISFGWNSGGIGKTNGFTITRILLVAHGGWHNDTICTVEVKQ